MSTATESLPRDCLVYLLYGNRQEYHLELTYSVVTARHQARLAGRALDIVLLCDRANARDDLPVVNRVVDDATMLAWRMGGRYSHMAKIHAMGYLLTAGCERAVMVDTDTIFRGDPWRLIEAVRPGHGVMHADEGALRDYASRDLWATIFAKLGGVLLGHSVDLECRMYNSGVVGVHLADAAIVADVVAMATLVTELHPVFNIEQFAFGLAMTRNGGLSTCEDVVEHYWGGPRTYYHLQIADLLAGRDAGVIRDMIESPPELRKQPPIKLRHRIAAGFLRRWRKWTPAYAHAWIACRSAFDCGDARLADVWADSAAGILLFGQCGDVSRADDDFALMAPHTIDRHPWLTTDTKERWRRFWATRGPFTPLQGPTK